MKDPKFAADVSDDDDARFLPVDPQTWLAETIAGIPDYKITRVADLLPWK